MHENLNYFFSLTHYNAFVMQYASNKEEEK